MSFFNRKLIKLDLSSTITSTYNGNSPLSISIGINFIVHLLARITNISDQTKDLVMINRYPNGQAVFSGLTAGFGVLYNGIALDFGWADYAILDNTWQLGLSFNY